MAFWLLTLPWLLNLIECITLRRTRFYTEEMDASVRSHWNFLFVGRETRAW